MIGALKRYLKNCFLLLIPILIWNLLFYSNLPEAYTDSIIEGGIPNWLIIVESLLRIMVMIFPLSMIFSLKTKRQKLGIGLYLFGTSIYFASWLPLIYDEYGTWSTSLVGFLAPAYTPLLWLMGIALVGEQSFLGWKKANSIYIILAILFILSHIGHSVLRFKAYY